MALNFLNNGYFGGKLGIGTESPFNKMHVNTSVDGDGLLLDYTANNNKYVGVFFKVDTNTSDAYKKGALVWERTGSYNEGRFHFLLNNDDNASNVDLTDSKVTILSTGNVGIGTDSPGTKLHIKDGSSGFTGTFDARNKSIIEANGEAYFATYVPDNSFSGLRFFNSTALKGFIDYYHGTQGDALVYSATGYHKFITSGTEKVRIINNGNVGIGTTAPLHNLQIGNAGTNGSYSMMIEGNFANTALSSNPRLNLIDTNFGITAGKYGSGGADDAIGIFAFQGAGRGILFAHTTAGSGTTLQNMRHDMFVDGGTGNVGIGTTSPTTKLQVSGKSFFQDDIFTLQNKGIFFNGLDDFSSGIAGIDSGTSVRIFAGGSEKVRVKSTGNVGIGTTSPDLKLDVTHATAGEYVATFQNTGANLELKLGVTSTSYLNIQGQQINNSAAFNISLQADGGNVGINTTIPTQKLHVVGNARVTGAYYDSNNSPGTANQVLTSTVTGTDWVDGSAIPGVPGGSGTLNTIPLWTPDGDTLGNSVLKQNGNNIEQGVVGTTASAYYFFNTTTTGDSGLIFKDNASTNSGFLTYNHDVNAMKFGTSGTERMRIFSNGNVNIGVAETGSSAVTGPFVVTHSSSRFLTSSFEESTVSLSAKNNNNNLESLRLAGDSIKFFNGTNTVGSQTMVILSSGNVGIGTTGPTSKLHIVDDEVVLGNVITDYRDLAIQVATSQQTANSGTGISFDHGGLGAAIASARVVNNTWGTDLRFYTHPNATTNQRNVTERMRIDAAGMVGIGIIPGNGFGLARLSLGTGAVANEIISFASASGGNAELRNTSSTGTFTFTNSDGSSEKMRILANGNVGIGTTNPTAKLHVVGTGLFTGLVSGITPVAAANFVTKAYVDGSGGGTGPFLPLAGGTMTGTNGVIFPDNFNLKIGTGSDLKIFHNATDSFIINEVGNLKITQGANDKDIIFESDDGSGGTTPYLTLDSSITKMVASKDIHFDGTVKATFGSNATPASIYYNGNEDVDTGTETVANVVIATHTAAFFDFVIKKTTNVRSGTVYACHDGTTVQFTETSTQDLGDTSDVTLSVDISGGNMRLRATTTSDNWSIKSLIRAI